MDSNTREKLLNEINEYTKGFKLDIPYVKPRIYNFKCNSCGKCCHFDNFGVKLSLEDLCLYLKKKRTDILEKIGLYENSITRKEEMFLMTKYEYDMYKTSRTVPILLPNGFKEDELKDCVFLEENRCSIYSYRPLNCISYPWANLNRNNVFCDESCFNPDEIVEHPETIKTHLKSNWEGSGFIFKKGWNEFIHSLIQAIRNAII